MAHERRGLTFLEAVTDELYEDNKRLRKENETLSSYFALVDAHFDEYHDVGAGMFDLIEQLTYEKDAIKEQMQHLEQQNQTLQQSNKALKDQVTDMQAERDRLCNQVSDAVLVAVPIPMDQLKQETSLVMQVQQLQQHNKALQNQIDWLSAAREQTGHVSVKAFASTLSKHLDAVADRRAAIRETSNQDEVSQTPDPLAVFARQLSMQLTELASRPKLRRRSE